LELFAIGVWLTRNLSDIDQMHFSQGYS
jgi:hypothetical protein